MVTIVGTTGNDTIIVDNDVGELNGSTIPGGAVDSIRGRAGNDTITITDSTLSQNLRANGGADVVSVTDSTITGVLAGGGGNDDIVVSNSSIGSNLSGGGGDDTIVVTNSTVSGNLNLGNSNDLLIAQDSTLDSINAGTGDDTITLINTSVTDTINGNTGTDVLNLPSNTTIDDGASATNITVSSGVAYTLTSGQATLPTGQVITYSNFSSGTGVPCFTAGTLIASAAGPCPVEHLDVGDLVPTQENGPQAIRWIGKRRLTWQELRSNPKLQPICITAGALGNGLPTRDLRVSRQHRMLVKSAIAHRMFGTSDVLIPAFKLTALPGIYVDETPQDVTYVHLLFNQHEIIEAEGAPTESLFTGPGAMTAVGDAARAEILALFPELARRDYDPVPAKPIPPNKQQKQLILRHLKNGKPILPSA